MVRRLGLGKNNHLTYASLALNPRYSLLFYAAYVFALPLGKVLPTKVNGFACHVVAVKLQI